MFRRDGSVNCHEFGIKNDESFDATLQGSIGKEGFQKLEERLHHHKFFSMKNSGYPMDAPYVAVTATSQLGAAQVTGQSVVLDSPDGFDGLVAMIEELAATVKMTKVKVDDGGG